MTVCGSGPWGQAPRFAAQLCLQNLQKLSWPGQLALLLDIERGSRCLDPECALPSLADVLKRAVAALSGKDPGLLAPVETMYLAFLFLLLPSSSLFLRAQAKLLLSF